MIFDYRKLTEKIEEKYAKKAHFAEALGISEVTLFRKMNNESEWTHDEIYLACELLGISMSDVADYFFVLDDKNFEHTEV